MLRLGKVSIMVFASMLLCVGSARMAQANPFTFVAFYSGDQEVPARPSLGSGIGVVTLDGNLLTFNITFAGLSANVSDSHIHCCAPAGANAGVAIGFVSTGFPLGVTSGTYLQTFDLTNAAIYNTTFFNNVGGGTVDGARTALINALFSGQTYLNIHTSLFPGGEIRGQVQLVPEPATMLLLTTGAIGLAIKVRRRRGRT